MVRVRGSLSFGRIGAVICMSVGFVLVSLVAMGQDVSLAGAVERGNKEAVRSLLSQQVDVNESQGDGATALHWAVYLNDADTTALLSGLVRGSINQTATVRQPSH